MKKMLKRILPCLLIVFSLLTIVSCKDKDEYKYPSEVPLYTEDGTFVQIGDLKVSNKEVYNRLLQSYGVEVLKDIIDEKLLADVKLTDAQEKEFAKQMQETIDEYETFEEFEESMLASGLHTDESKSTDPLYYVNHYKLEYKRYVKTLEVLKQEIVEFNKEAAEAEEETDPYFVDEDYISYFSSNYHKTYNLIIVTFDSEIEAKAAMDKAGVDVNNLSGDWQNKLGEKMVDEQIQAAFKSMYKTAYGETCEGTKTYTYDDLYNISSSSSKDSTILNRATKLNKGEYTHGPLLYTNRWFVMYCGEVNNVYVNDKDDSKTFADDPKYFVEKDANNNITEISEEFKNAIYDELVVSSLTSDSTFYTNTIERVMFKLRQDAGLEIFAEGLEINYKSAYESAFAALDITDYDAFKATTNTSSTLVAKWNGGEITVQNMFDKLTAKYGALLTLLFMQHYNVMKDNKVVNYVTGEVLDQDAYDDYVEEDIDAYKESFEEGNFESYGFPASYGWENFLRDYIGLSDQAAIIVDFNSTLYEDTLVLYKQAIYTADVKDVTVYAKADNEGNKTWYLNSSKWAKEYNTGIKVVDESVLPELSVAWTEDDVTEEDAKDKNNYYGHFVLTYKNAEGNTVKDVTPVTVDQAVLEEYDAIYDKTFSATTSGFYVYYDKDLDGVEDEIEETSEEASKALQLIQALWEEILPELNEDGTEPIPTKTIAESAKEIVRQYNVSTNKWLEYKQAGLRVKVISDSTYSNATNADDNLKAEVKNMWETIMAVKDKEGKEALAGKSLELAYRYTNTDKVVTYATAYQFARNSDTVFADNGYYKLAVTKAATRTAKVSSSGSQKPSLYYYEQYQLDADDRDSGLKINCGTQITTYYTPAMTNLASDIIVNNLLMTANQELLANVTFTSNNEQLKATLTALIAAGFEDVE